MQADTVTTISLAGRTILVSPDSSHTELKTELEHRGARVLTWPQLDLRALDNCDALDESIENLFGYDWLIFRHINAVDFFLRRFQELGHEISELDSLRVCGVGEESVHKLEASQVHLDVIPDRLSSQAVFGAIETYAGGRDAFRGLTFLIPGAGASRDYLPEALQDAGARVDLVPTYHTCAANDPALARINALVTGGGIDCVAFTTSAEVKEFAAVFDTNDLNRLVDGIAVACIDETTLRTIARFSLTADIVPKESTGPALSQAIALYFPH
jgi:uroporphyrinogen III methyltransferase/synthase